MNRETQNLLLLLIGGAVLWTALDGSYLRYVKPGLFPFLVISGVGFVLLGLIAIVRDVRRGEGSADHEHGTGRAQWLLLAPAAALLLIAPPALGAGAATTASPVRVVSHTSANEPKVRPFPPLPDEPAPTLTIYELVNRALLDSNHSLDGREVTISGFALGVEDSGQPRPPGIDLDLARVLITCCVADARYIYVHLSGIAEPIESDTWLEVRGVVTPGSAQHDPVQTPTLVVTDFRRIPAPDRRYEHSR
ncbi:TIGR03943 family protein [Nocardia amamiensis]|uniref:TIGR03943 family protein n=1 Tax=Nocardia amamiensis TaxID=404578 RepID=A0ABS0D1T0_9NOCA|nr:TIGR03943 family protein [Nocardia amamiensis]MBF6302591.1 TIGR03943 family protein [Nocardia amamiensis]